MEKAIKQRLLGGLVLVAGAVLFLPVLLDGSGARLATPAIPAAPDVPGVEAIAPALDEKVASADSDVEAAHADRTFPAEEAAPAAPVNEGEVAPDAAALTGENGGDATAAGSSASPAAPVAAPKVAPPAKPEAKSPVQPVAPVAKPAPAATAAPKMASKPAAAAPLPEAWVVQVASLSSRDKAEALVKKLRSKNYAAVLRPQGSNWKVVVGPELNRSVADSIKARLAADPELRLNGWVQAYKP